MFKKTSSFFFALTILMIVISCKDDVLPKPASQLRLDYPVANYAKFSNHCPFEFEMNGDAIIKEDKFCEFSIHYPKMKATIYLTYKTVNKDPIGFVGAASQILSIVRSDGFAQYVLMYIRRINACWGELIIYNIVFGEIYSEVYRAFKGLIQLHFHFQTHFHGVKIDIATHADVGWRATRKLTAHIIAPFLIRNDDATFIGKLFAVYAASWIALRATE
jgi:hypothetical protein